MCVCVSVCLSVCTCVCTRVCACVVHVSMSMFVCVMCMSIILNYRSVFGVSCLLSTMQWVRILNSSNFMIFSFVGNMLDLLSGDKEAVSVTHSALTSGQHKCPHHHHHKSATGSHDHRSMTTHRNYCIAQKFDDKLLASYF